MKIMQLGSVSPACLFRDNGRIIVLSAFTSRPISLLANTEAVFYFIVRKFPPNLKIVIINQKLMCTNNLKPAFIKDWNTSKSLVFAELWHMPRHGLFRFIFRGQDKVEERSTVIFFLYLTTMR